MRENKPEQKYTYGTVSAAIWQREVTTREGKRVVIRQAGLDRRYPDKQGIWKTTHSYDVNEIPKAILALMDAYRYILNQGAVTESEDSPE